MKNIVILGSGSGGTMVATLLRRQLDEKEWKITIIDRDWQHHYQPGWLFIPFGIYSAADCVKPKSDFIPNGVDFVLDEVTGIDPKQRVIKAKQGLYNYDWLVIATGCRIMPDEIDGMMEDWRNNICDFYTLEGRGPAEENEVLRQRQGGAEYRRVAFQMSRGPPGIHLHGRLVFYRQWG